MRLLTIDQFAKECGVDKEMIRYHIKNNKISAISKYPTIIDADQHLNILKFYATKREFKEFSK